MSFSTLAVLAFASSQSLLYTYNHPSNPNPRSITRGIQPSAELTIPPVVSMMVSEGKIKKKRKVKRASGRKPRLICQGFKNKRANIKVKGFSASLQKKSPKLSTYLAKYLRQGGNLSRCRYSILISRSDYKAIFVSQPPSSIQRTADKYSLKVYPSYSAFLKANRPARFGVFYSRIKSERYPLRLTFNNALVLLSDRKNRMPFALPGRNKKISLLWYGKNHQTTIDKAIEASLKSLIKNKKSSTRANSAGFDVYAELAQKDTLIAVLLNSSAHQNESYITDFPRIQLFENHHNKSPMLRPVLMRGIYFAQTFTSPAPFLKKLKTPVLPQGGSGNSGSTDSTPKSTTNPPRKLIIPGRLLNPATIQQIIIPGVKQTDSVDTEETLTPEPVDSETDLEYGVPEYEVDTDSTEAPEAEGPEVEQSLEDSDSSTEEEIPTDELTEESETELDSDEGPVDQDPSSNQDSYEDGDGMIPEDMAAPSGPTCNARTFGEQLLCAFMKSLSNMMNDAFSK